MVARCLQLAFCGAKRLHQRGEATCLHGFSKLIVAGGASFFFQVHRVYWRAATPRGQKRESRMQEQLRA